jgi:hypothetical protein
MRGDRLKQMERLEESIAELLYRAEQWTVTGATLYDLKGRRQELLEAARRYGRAVDALARFK